MRKYGCLALGLLPFLELFILILAASAWGWQPVLIIILITGALGLAIIRLGIATTGRSLSEAMRLLQQRKNQQEEPEFLELGATPLQPDDHPTDLTADITPPAQSMLLIPAGVLLALPGFIGDALGILMTIPAVRTAIAARWQARLQP